MFELRPYQKECIDIIDNIEEPGSYLVVLATAMGKTVIFSHLKRRGRVLLLSHREELVHQPEKYYTDCSFGVERADESSNGEDVVSASVQTLIHRLHKFAPDEFDMIITDEAHHAAAPSYQKIYDYFKPRLHLGFTATPKRGDGVRLDHVFSKIIYEKDLKWGIQNNYLTDINCLKVNIGYDLSKVKKRMGDYDSEMLEKAVNQKVMNEGIASAYKKYAVGQTLIFATSVAHAYAIAAEIEGAVVITGKTKNRKEIIDQFTCREIPCIVNCMVLTEGTDIPLIETIIIARPTLNASLYTQMVGRGLRKSPGKEYLTLIDCVGVSTKLDICTAPTLLGLDPSVVPTRHNAEIVGKLSEMEEKIKLLTDSPEAWIINATKVDLFAKETEVDLKKVNWILQYDDSLLCEIGEGNDCLKIEPANELGLCNLSFITCRVNHYLSQNISRQRALDIARKWLEVNFPETKSIWDMELVNRWGKHPASEKQKCLIKKELQKQKNLKKYNCPDFDVENLTKYQASTVIGNLLRPSVIR